MLSITRIAHIEVYCCRFSAMPIDSLAALISWAVTAYFDSYVYRGINSVIATKSIILIVCILNIQTYLNKCKKQKLKAKERLW